MDASIDNILSYSLWSVSCKVIYGDDNAFFIFLSIIRSKSTLYQNPKNQNVMYFDSEF